MRVDVKKLIQELVVPEIRQVLSEVQALRVEIHRLDEKIDLVRSELKAEMEARFEALHKVMDSLRMGIDSLRNETEARFSALHKEMDSLRNELESLRKEVEARIGALSDRIDVALELRERILKLETRLEALAGKVREQG